MLRIYETLPCLFPDFTVSHTRAKVKAQSRHLQASGAAKVKLAIPVERMTHGSPVTWGDLWVVGIGVTSVVPSSISQACSVSHRREVCVIKSPSKAAVITQEIDSEIEKLCDHRESPSPTSPTPGFLL